MQGILLSHSCTESHSIFPRLRLEHWNTYWRMCQCCVTHLPLIAIVLLTTVTLFLLAHLFQTWLAYNLFKIHLLRLLPKLPVCHRINFKIASITFKVLQLEKAILSRCPNSTVCADTITTIVFFLVNMCSYSKNCNGKVQIILTRCFI